MSKVVVSKRAVACLVEGTYSGVPHPVVRHQGVGEHHQGTVLWPLLDCVDRDIAVQFDEIFCHNELECCLLGYLALLEHLRLRALHGALPLICFP